MILNGRTSGDYWGNFTHYNIISNPIEQLLNRTMGEGVIPNDWKHAIFSAIYKKRPRTFASNYRPISLTSIICKLMETFVKCELMTHLINENLLSTKQHGFISGRYTTTQLLNNLDKCVETIVDGGVVDSNMDFAKAFDCVPHRRLIAKLQSHGIEGKVLNFISAFLSKRTQVVKD